MKSLTILAATILLMLAASCTAPDKPAAQVHEEMNSVYYWKTVFRLDKADRAFIMRHRIRRIYLRMFDVSEDVCAQVAEERAVPNASVRIGDEEYRLLKDTLKAMEFVPVVYITLDALKTMEGQEAVIASHIVERTDNMCRYNGLPNVRELQLDCDWTASTETLFFRLCKAVKGDIARRKLPWKVSSTIRLHQLSRKAPPVDRGVLMAYNTGNFKDPDAANSIIDAADVEPYLKHLPSYPLHLDVAYPAYSWMLLFRNRQFIGLLDGLDLTDTEQFSSAGRKVFIAKKDIPYRNMIIRQGDMIRAETSSYRDISAVKALIEPRLAGHRHSSIIYHLDSQNLSKYSSHEIHHILSAADR